MKRNYKRHLIHDDGLYLGECSPPPTTRRRVLKKSKKCTNCKKRRVSDYHHHLCDRCWKLKHSSD